MMVKVAKGMQPAVEDEFETMKTAAIVNALLEIADAIDRLAERRA